MVEIETGGRIWRTFVFFKNESSYITHTTLFTNLVVQHREKINEPLTKIKGKEHKNTYLSHQLRYVDEIWFADRLRPLKAAISTNAKPEIVLSGGRRHLDKAIWRHISAVAAPNEIRQANAEWNADYGEMVEIEARSRIPIWWTFVFPNQKSLYLSHKLIYVDYWCRYSHLDRRTYFSLNLMTSGELTSGFDLCHVAIFAWPWYNFPI